MGGEVLSQAEVENLLNIMTKGEEGEGGAPEPAAKPKPSAESASASPGVAVPASDSSSLWTHEKVTPYDFKRPERVGKEQMKALQTLHEGFGRNFAAGLSAMLRSIVEVKLTSVDQLTYSEFIFSLDNPTCFNLLRADPLEGNLILDINPSILYPMIDRMLGGGREGTLLARRPLTEIELRLVSRITDLFLNEMKHAWENVLELDLEVVQVESNPQLIQIVPPNEVVVLVCFEVALVEVRGIINLCIPYNAIERISSKLASNTWVSYGRRQATPQSIEKLSKSIRNMHVNMKVKLAETKVKMSDLINLQVGDIICTEKNVHSPLLVSVEGVPKYYAKPGAFKGFSAVQVEDVIEDPSSIIAEH
jgi:flagellar motor switch protein FliM